MRRSTEAPLREVSPAWAVARRLECGQLAPGGGRGGRPKSDGQPDALQTLARPRDACRVGLTGAVGTIIGLYPASAAVKRVSIEALRDE